MSNVEDRFAHARAVVLDNAAAGAAGAPWVNVLPEGDLRPEIGVPALIGRQAVAVFRTHAGEIYAVSNYDPVSGASVMARGIVGTRGEIPIVASPMYKHVFDLRTGRCLDDDSKTLVPYEVRIEEGVIQVRAPQPQGAGHDGH